MRNRGYCVNIVEDALYGFRDRGFPTARWDLDRERHGGPTMFAFFMFFFPTRIACSGK